MLLGHIFSSANENGEASASFDGKLDELVNREIVSYQDMFNRFNIKDNVEEQSLGYTTIALYSPICHLPQVIGILIARALKMNLEFQCYFSRISNFLIAVFILFFAIRYIPLKKECLVFLSLLPITFNELASMSADAITISSIAFFISYVMYLKFDSEKQMINKKDIIILTIFSIIVSQCKIVYLPLCLLLLIIPKNKFETSRKRNTIIFTIIGVSIFLNLLWLIYCRRFLAEFNAGVDGSLQIKYILTHPIEYVLIVFRTINTYFQYNVLCLCGEGLGSYNVQASVIYVIMCIVYYSFFIFVNYDKEIKIDLLSRIICVIVFISIVALIYTSIYMQWNPVKNVRVEGVQGRYFLPIILLTAFVIHNDSIKFEGKFDNKYLFIFMLFMNLNVITSILYTYIYASPLNFYVK